MNAVSITGIGSLIARVVVLLMDDKFRTRIQNTADAVREVIAEIERGGELPAKADGTPWTDADRAELFTAIETRMTSLIERMR